jgi:hypothetical protein
MQRLTTHKGKSAEKSTCSVLIVKKLHDNCTGQKLADGNSNAATTTHLLSRHKNTEAQSRNGSSLIRDSSVQLAEMDDNIPRVFPGEVWTPSPVQLTAEEVKELHKRTTLISSNQTNSLQF